MITKIQEDFDKSKISLILQKIASQARAADTNALYEYLPAGIPTLYVEIPGTGVVQLIPEGNNEIYAHIPHSLTRDGIITPPLAEISYVGYSEISKNAINWMNDLEQSGISYFKSLPILLESRGTSEQMHLEIDDECMIRE